MATPEIITDLSSWLRDHPDTAVFRCGCVWIKPTVAAISRIWPTDCPKHHPAQFRPGLFLPFKP